MLREPPANGFDSLDPASGFGSGDSIRAFGFGLKGGADIEIDSSGDVVVIPDAAFLFNADFHRDGRDLLITGDDGRRVVVHDYFAGDKRPALASREGATIAGHVVEAIVKQTSPTEVAQAGGQPAGGATPIGRVEKVTGTAFVIRNGVPVNLNAGDLVYKGDVVQTGAGSSIGIGFVDGSAFNLAANARMVLNEMVYDPNGTSNSALVSLVQGSISFLAGQVAKTGDMKVETPVATMGIRGTIVLVEITANNGPTKVTSVFDPTTGRVGEVVVWERNNLSNVIGRINTQDTALLITPTGQFQVVVTQVPVTDSERLAAQEVVRTVVDINAAMLANPLVPGLPGTQPPGPPGPGDPGQGTPGGIGGGGGGGGGGSGGTPDPLPNLGSTGGTTTTASFTPPSTPFTIPGSTIPTPTVVSGGGGGGGGGGGTAGGTGTGTSGENAPPVLAPDTTPSHTPTGASGGSGPAQAGGTLTFSDPDSDDTHQAAVSAGSAQWTRADNSQVETAIPPATLAALGTALAITAVDSAAGTVQWSFSLAQEAAWFLAEGERLAVTYEITVTDAAGETSTQPVTIVIVGTNDGPVFLGSRQTGAAEDADTLTVVGEALFADADLSDIHGVTAAPDPATPGNVGTLIAGVLHDTTGAGTGGVVGWAYQADQDAVRALAAGEARTDSFVLTLADSHGATTTQTVAVTLVGENDAPEVSGPVAGAATEDAGPVALDALANATDVDHGAALQVVDVPATLPAGVTFDAATHTFTLDPSHPAYQSLAAGATATVTVAYGVSDGFVTTPATAQWTVTGTNDAPVIAPLPDDDNPEDQPYTVSAAQVADFIATYISDVDNPTSDLTFTVEIRHGATLLHTFVIDGADPQGFSFTPPPDFNGDLLVTVTASDGAATSAPRSFTLTIVPVNDPPVNAVPAAQSVAEDTALVFSTANGNAVTVSDIDIGGGSATVTLSVLHGTLTLGSTAGLSGLSGNGTGSVTLTGTQSAINAALDGLAYKGNADFNGADTLTVTTSDNGHSGIPGPRTDSDTVAITVTAVNDAPAIGGDGDITVQEGGLTTVTVVDLSATDPDTANSQLVYTVTGTVHGTVLLNNVATTSFTQADLAANLVEFHHDGSETTSGSFTVSVTDGTAPAQTRTVNATVTPTNDPPTVTGTPPSATLVEAGTPGFTPNTGTFTAYIDLTIGDPDAGDSAHYDLSDWGDFDPTAAGAVQWTAANGGNGHWYKYVSNPLVWADARQAALNVGGYLANVTSLTENEFIQSLKGGEVAWLGGSDDGHEGVWQWVDGPEGGRTFSIGNAVQTGFFANWWGSEPNNAGAGEHYVYIDGNKAWTDVAGTLVEPASFGANGYVVEFSYSKRGTYGWASFDPTTGRVTYTLDNGDPDTQALKATDEVEDIFDITVKDNDGASTTFQAKFKIQGQNDAPNAVDDAAEADAGSASVPTIRGNLTGNDTDPEHDFLYIEGISHGETGGQFGPGGFTVDGTYGRLFVEPDSTYSYTLWTNVPGASESQIAAVADIPPGETRLDTFGYRIGDGSGGHDEAELAITVNGPPPSANTAPVFEPASHMEVGPAVLVSRDADGDPGTAASSAPSFSGDGSRIAFDSYADLLDDEANLTNPGVDDSDIFVRMEDGSLVRASTSASGEEADDASYGPVLSPDGTKVAFWSYATNLIDGEDDTNESADIFLKNLATGEIERLTVGLDGQEADFGSFWPRFSPDGSKIAFWSYATNLVANDENEDADVFVVEVESKVITRWSIGDGGQEADGFSTDPEFSPDGSKIVFVSRAENLVDGDTNNGTDIFVRELTPGGRTIRVSTASDGSQAENPDSEGSVNSGDPVFSPDGTKVAFASDADNLVDGDTNGSTDIFVKDLVTGAIVRVNTSSHGVEARNGYSLMPAFSPDGTRIAFISSADNLVPGDDNGTDDLFVKDLATGAIVLVSEGMFGMGFHTSFAPDGRIAFSALSLEGNPSGPREQVFVAPLADVEGGPVTDYVVDDPTAGTLTTGGRLRFADPDAGDTHTVGLFPADGNLGTLTPVLGTDEAGNPVVDWTYTVPQSAARGLDAGETRTDRFTVRVTDSHGAQADQEIEITIHGTNAAPQVEGDKVVAFAEDTSGPVPLHIAPAFDFDGDPIQIVVDAVPEPSFGEIRKANGTPLAVGQILLASELAGLTFTPGSEPDFDPAVFTYHAVDEHGTESEPSTVRLEQVATTTAGRRVDFDDINVNPPGDTDGPNFNLSIPNGYGAVGHFPGFFWNFFGVLGDVYPSYSEPNSAYANSPQFVSSISSLDGSEFVVDSLEVARLTGATRITITAIDMGHVVGTLTVDLSGGDFSNAWHHVQPNFGPVTQLHIQAEGIGSVRQWQLDDFEFTTVPTFAGDFGNDVLFGGAANESFHGSYGNDTIMGGAGGDTLNGGQGRDLMDGGADGDIYRFYAVFESGFNDDFEGGATADDADVIVSFVQDEDAIDLSVIDADTSDTFNDDFLWGDESTEVLANGITWYKDTAHDRTVIQVDNTGDTTADMTIVIAGIMNLRAVDFFGVQGL